MNEPDLKSLLPGGEDCRSWKEIAPNMHMTPERLGAFLNQSDECVFMTGACHVMAAALFEEFTRRGVRVSVIEMTLEGRFQHYLVGRLGVCVTDVRLLSEPPSGFECSEISAIKARDLAVALGRVYCCTEPDFLVATKARAAAFIAKNTDRIDELAHRLTHVG